jgi:UDP-N-acetylglucosamine--N-acetylmuramyl-(pentapeptide) pyrophosphoryl-undecaprenol N-acetylglucosamine transferase
MRGSHEGVEKLKNTNTQIQVKLDAATAGLPVILVMAGGTGGHVFPALAVARWLADAGYRIVWVGNPSGMEAELVPKHGFEMAWVSFSGLRGKGPIAKLLLPGRLLLAFAQSIAILLRLKPKAVAGFGGYISFPAGMMAALLGKPLLLHEQNAIAGLSNKVLAKVADQVMTAFPDALPKAVWTGNPVRPEIARLPEPAERYAGRNGPLNLLLVGGSLGAQALNQTVPHALGLLPQQLRPRVTHQSGAGHLEALRAEYAKAGVAADTVDFIEDMAAAYARADLVICRAGAMTVAEVACAGVAALFVPFPYAVDDHQTANARFLSGPGAALLAPQGSLTPQSLATTLQGLSREQCLAMAIKARALGKPDATRAVAQACLELAENK